MTKVKESKARKTGTASASATQKKALEGRKTISAERNGEQRNFSALVWNNLPPDKEGWTESSAKPADIDTTNQQPVKDPVTDNKTKAADKATATPVVPAKADGPEMVDYTLTQDDLDLDAELAKSGKKVGDVIQIEKLKGGVE